MASFDPDSYLAQSAPVATAFNPDDYLSTPPAVDSFDPDSYLNPVGQSDLADSVGVIDGTAGSFKRGVKSLGQAVDAYSFMNAMGDAQAADNKAQSIAKTQSAVPELRRENFDKYGAEADNRYRRALSDRRLMSEVRQSAIGRSQGEAKASRKSATGLLQQIATTKREIDAIPQSRGKEEFDRAEGLGASLKAVASRPLDTISGVIAESVPASVPSLVGGAVGSLGGPAGTALGAGAPSMMVEYASNLAQELQAQGIDPTDEKSVEALLNDPEKLEAMRNKALKRGAPVAMLDALSAGIAGRIFRAPAKAVAKRIAQGATELGVQAGLGGAGEALGALNAGEKVDPKAVLAEILGESGTGGVEVATGAIRDRFQGKSVPRSTPELDNSLANGSAPALELAPAASPELAPAEPAPLLPTMTLEQARADVAAAPPAAELDVPPQQKPLAPATFIGLTDDGRGGFIELFNTHEEINGIPSDSTRARKFLEDNGYYVPAMPEVDPYTRVNIPLAEIQSPVSPPIEAAPQNETIAGAAFQRPSGEVLTGSSHFDILNRLTPELESQIMAEVPTDGFVTNTGRFVGREEAAAIASRSDPELVLRPDGGLSSESIGQPQPQLDTQSRATESPLALEAAPRELALDEGGGASPPPNPPEGGSPPPAGDEPPPQRDLNFKLPETPGIGTRAKGAVKAGAKLLGKGADYLLGPIMTRINKVAPEVGRGAAGRYEFNVRTKSNAYRSETIPFSEKARKILKNPDDIRRLNIFLGDGDFEGAIQLLTDRGSSTPALVDEAIADFDRALTAKNDLHATAQDSGLDAGEIQNHWPRKVDPDQLDNFLKVIGREKSGPIWEAVKQRADKLGIKPEDLTPEERGEITNQVIRGVNLSGDGGIPAQLKSRGITSIRKLDQFYLPFDQAMTSYTDGLVRTIEKRKLFGRTPSGSEGSLGAAIERAREYGLTPESEADIVSMFQSRFGPGERSMNKVIKAARDTTTVAYLTQLRDALTQVGDFVLTPARYGVKDFVGALINPNEITADSIGLEQIGQEFTNRGRATKSVEKLFKSIGFSQVIKAAQNNTLNASLRYLRRRSRTPDGIREIRAKYERAMGEEFPALLDDLQNNRVTENTKFAAFTEITDSQPITLMEMPQGALDNPNGKIGYAMKTYPLKQLDLFRRDAFGNIIEGRKNVASGNKKLGKEQIRRGARNLIALAAAYTLGGAGTDFVKDMLTPGREIDPEEYAWTALFRLGLMNRYDLHNLERNGLGSMIRDKIAPAWQLADEATQAVVKGDPRILKRVPIIGDDLFSMSGGGEKQREADRKRKAAKERESSLTDEQRTLRDESRERMGARKKYLDSIGERD